jgi:molecular chaperone GrpE
MHSSANHPASQRKFSTKPEEKEETPPTPDAPTAEESNEESTAESPPPTKEEQLMSEIKDLKDSLLRSLAEQENTRRIASRDVASAKQFAISSFAKSLLDTSDNLSRALDAVPEELRHDHENHPVLANLYEGITMTNEGLDKAFAKNGLKKFGMIGDKFDPNIHEALFEYPDPKGEPGCVGQVMKVGFMLNERVVRPAEVGVVKAG